MQDAYICPPYKTSAWGNKDTSPYVFDRRCALVAPSQRKRTIGLFPVNIDQSHLTCVCCTLLEHITFHIYKKYLRQKNVTFLSMVMKCYVVQKHSSQYLLNVKIWENSAFGGKRLDLHLRITEKQKGINVPTFKQHITSNVSLGYN